VGELLKRRVAPSRAAISPPRPLPATCARAPRIRLIRSCFSFGGSPTRGFHAQTTSSWADTNRRQTLFDYQGPFFVLSRPHDKRGARSIRMLQRIEVGSPRPSDYASSAALTAFAAGGGWRRWPSGRARRRTDPYVWPSAEELFLGRVRQQPDIGRQSSIWPASLSTTRGSRTRARRAP